MPRNSPNKKWRDTGQLPEPLQIQILSTSPSSQTIELLTLPPFRLPRRYARLALACIIALSIIYLFGTRMLAYRESPSLDDLLPSYPTVRNTPPTPPGRGVNESSLPPLYEEYRKYEDLLSEKNLEEAPEDARYIFFANHAHGSGWGNVLQEMVFSAMLASEAKLGYVWDDYTWDKDAAKYSTFNGKPVPARIPLSTMLSGHILGLGRSTEAEEKDPNSHLPPSISNRLYQQICPQQNRAIIDRNIVQSDLDQAESGIMLSSASGNQIVDAWLATLRKRMYKYARCIEVNKNASDHVFDIWLLGSPRMHSLWDTLSHSPVLTNWAWSPLIKASFLKNIQYFAADNDLQERDALGTFLRNWWWWDPNAKTPTSPTETEPTSKIIPTPKARRKLLNDTQPLPILVLHLRRGDFQEHCNNLAGWSSTYTGFNSFPESRERDAFDVPQVVEMDLSQNHNNNINIQYPEQESDIDSDPREVHSEDEKKRVYATHCYPGVQQIIKRVKEVVRDYAIFAEERERRRVDSQKPNERGVVRWWPNKDSFPHYGYRHRDPQPHLADGHGRRADNSMMKSGLLRNGNVASKQHLKKIYIMANGDREWLEHVKKMLKKSGQSWGGRHGLDDDNYMGWTWEGIATSRDLDLGWEERPVAQALDMYVAQRAELFIGNGFSSLTSNTVMLRMKAGFDPVQTRFW